MLKMFAKGEKNGRPMCLIVLGLSHMNIQKLKEGRPIKFNGADIGISSDIEFMIFAGETEQSMQRELSSFIGPIGPETVVHIDPRLKDLHMERD
jgi:hypothetical protein